MNVNSSVLVQVGLKGETLSLHSLTGSSSVEWGEPMQKQPLTWYKVLRKFIISIAFHVEKHYFSKDHSFIYSVQAFFNAPDGDEPLALDMSSMGKGQIWINGQGIGRYWPGYKASGTCGICDYRGEYDDKKCQFNCGDSSQRWYAQVTASISMKSLQLKLLHSLHACSGTTSLVHGLIRRETFWLYLRSGAVILPESRW